jgi:hypothetical protein
MIVVFEEFVGYDLKNNIPDITSLDFSEKGFVKPQ